MPWLDFFILTVQILIWSVVLALPLYLLAGSVANAVGRGFRTGFFGIPEKKDERKIL